MSGELKKIEDFYVRSVERVSGGQVLSRETFNEQGDSLGREEFPHVFQADAAAMYAACHCGKAEQGEIHRCGACGGRLEGEIAEVVRSDDGCPLCWNDFLLDHKTDHAHEPGARARHIVVHEPCFDRETMELA